MRSLYEEAFPAEERIPYDDLCRLLSLMPLEFVAYYDGQTFVGLTMVLRRADFNWFWYFAVSADLRGQGYGQQILSSLTEQYADHPLILDIESPLQECENAAQRRRRYAFYLRNGFRDTHTGKSFDGIDYTILLRGKGIFTQSDYDRIILDLREIWESLPQEE